MSASFQNISSILAKAKLKVIHHKLDEVDSFKMLKTIKTGSS